jgi:hypothetical protein
MFQYTKTIDKKEYVNTLKNVLNEIEILLSTESLAYLNNNEAFVSDRLLTYLRQTQNGSSLERLIKGQVLEATFRSEISGPNSTDMFLSFSIETIRNILMLLGSGKSHKQIEESMTVGYENLKSELQKNKINPKWEDIIDLVSSVSRNKRVSDMVVEAVKLSGLEGNIIPSHSHKGYSVELVSGYNFEVSTYPQFTSENGGRWERRSVRVLVVDGVIEKESEIHNVFTKAFEDENPLLIVARGYGEEVIATILANKRLDICPIRVPFEVESINLITDISVICGSFLVTPMKGDLINNVDYDELPIVEQVLCTKEKLNLVDSNFVKSVNDHINDLCIRRDQSSQEKGELLSKRIKALCSHTVHLRVGSKTKQEAMKELESADFSLRLVKGILDKGIVDPSATISEFGKFHKMRPTISVLSAAHHGIALSKALAFTEIAIMSEAI